MSDFSTTASGSPSGHDRIRPAQVLFWLLILLAPFLSAGLLQLLTGTSALRLDAWNTTWNDEVGYYRVIRLLRYEFYPQGMYGFNEDAPAHLAYGPYNIFTYLPYFVLSFLTGIEGHNFICFCNVILAVLAGRFYVLLVRPGAKQGFFTTLFLVSYLVAGRYIWSGMSESSYNFFLIFFTALVLWMVKNPNASNSKTSVGSQKAALTAMILIVFFWNTMRPYYFPLLLIPVYMIFRKKSRLSAGAKAFFLVLCAAAAAASLGLFFFFTGYNVARYFFDSTQTETLKQLLSSGSPVIMIKEILRSNLDALREIKGYLRDSRWAGGIPLLYFAQSLILLIILVRTLFTKPAKKDDRCAVIFFMLLAGAAIYEANVVLYSPVQLHRMMLAVTLAYGLLIIELGTTPSHIAGELAVLAVMLFFVLRAPQNFRLPQVDENTLSTVEEEALKLELRGVLPLEDAPWDNTIAKLPESEALQWEYMLPTYTSLNVCQTHVLEKLLTDGTVRSKFVLLADGSDLNKLCVAQKYRVVWQGYGRTMYQTRD